jgi:nucleoside-diphosphate-sugar epimerase
MSKKKNILITGASGAVGSEILKQISNLTDQYKVTIFDLKTKESINCFRKYKHSIEIVYGDIAQNDEVEKVCHDKDFVIHLAAIIPPRADKFPALAEKVNVIGTKNLVHNLELFSPNAFFLYASSISVYGDRLNDPWIKVTDPLVPSIGDEYAKTKIEAERIVRDARLDWTIFRLTAVMGKHKLSELLFHMPLSTPLEIATPYDTSTAFVNAIDKRDLLSRRIFNLGGGAAYRTVYKDFLALSFDAIGLGELNFPENSFAEKNFHCGYYYDSNELQDILEFQNGTIDDYFHSVRKSTNTFKRFSTMLFSKVIKRVLLVKSEPLKALQSNDKVMKERFFID